MPITFFRPTSQVMGCLRTEPPPLRCRTSNPPGLAIGALNTQDDRGYVLAQTIREV